MNDNCSKTVNIDYSKTASYCLLLILVLTFFTFSSSLGYDFIWDDKIFTNNVATLSAQTFIEPYYVDLRETTQLNYFRPLSRLSFIVDQILWKDMPSGFHLTNILLHCLNVWLIYLFFRKMKIERILSLIGCALFATHPLVIQPVCWISGRTDTLCATFALASLICFLQCCRKPTIFYGLMTLTTLSFSLLTKEMAVSLPLIFLLIFLRSGKRDKKYLTILLVLAFMVLTAYLGIRFQVVDSNTANLSIRPQGMTALIATSSKIFLHYIKQFVLPQPVVEYDHSDFICKTFDTSQLVYIGGFAFILGLSIYTFFKDKEVITSILPLALFTTYIPISNFFPFYPPVADRFAYILHIFFIGSVIHLISKIPLKAKHLKYSGVVICICVFIYGSWYIKSNSYAYKNNIKLFSKMIEQSPNHRLGYLALSSILLDEGGRENTERAKQCLKKTLNIPRPGKGPYYYSTLLVKNDEHEAAIKVLKDILDKNTLYKEFYLAQLVSLLCEQKQYKKALSTMKELPDDLKKTSIYESLEIELLLLTGKWAIAINKSKNFLKKYDEETSSINVRINLARAYSKLKERDKALKLIRINASHRHGTDHEVKVLGDFLARGKQKQEALLVYDSLLPPGPVKDKGTQLIILHQASRYFAAGFSDKAEELWKQAITGPLQFAKTYSALALLLLQKGKREEALIYLNKCILCKDGTKAHEIAADILKKSILKEKFEVTTSDLEELTESDQNFVNLVAQLAKK